MPPSIKKSVIIYRFILLCCFVSFSHIITSHAMENKDPMSIWPKAKAGYKRIAIELPQLKNEDLYRIELIPQQTMKTDCNHIMINGEMETKPLTGWGYEYYVLTKIYEPASTRMACFPDIKQSKGITIRTNLPFIRYNSKLPIIVYIPKGIRLSYRVWSANPIQNAENK